MTRTGAILLGIQRLLETRRRELDAASDLRNLVLDLKFEPGMIEPLAIVDRIERETARPDRLTPKPGGL
jgi:hypothetical protein